MCRVGRCVVVLIKVAGAVAVNTLRKDWINFLDDRIEAEIHIIHVHARVRRTRRGNPHPAHESHGEALAHHGSVLAVIAHDDRRQSEKRPILVIVIDLKTETGLDGRAAAGSPITTPNLRRVYVASIEFPTETARNVRVLE